MAERYGGARSGRLTFKGVEVAVRQSAGKKKRSKKAKSKPKGEDFASANPPEDASVVVPGDIDAADEDGGGGGEEIYTIDAAKRMKYDELFPVEARKFGYEPKSKAKSVEDVLDDRVRKKADRYCKRLRDFCYH